MNVLAAHRHFQDLDVGIWNNMLYFNRGTQREVRQLNSFEELSNAMSEILFLPDYPLREAIDELKKNAVDIFSVAE